MKAVCIKSFIPDSEKNLTQDSSLRMKVFVLKVYRIRKYIHEFDAYSILIDDMSSCLASSCAFITKEELNKNFKII